MPRLGSLLLALAMLVLVVGCPELGIGDGTKKGDEQPVVVILEGSGSMNVESAPATLPALRPIPHLPAAFDSGARAALPTQPSA